MTKPELFALYWRQLGYYADRIDEIGSLLGDMVPGEDTAIEIMNACISAAEYTREIMATKITPLAESVGYGEILTASKHPDVYTSFG